MSVVREGQGTVQQQEILTNLLAIGKSRPSFDNALAGDLISWLAEKLAPAAAFLINEQRLVINKHHLSHSLACEGLYAADLEEEFAWTTANVKGTIVHGAIERFLLSPNPQPPLDLVHRTIDRLAEKDEGWGPGEFLRMIDEDERLEIIRDANDAVTKFVIDWPPIPTKWTPRIESRFTYPLFEGLIELKAKLDLAIGRPTDDKAKVIIIDFKTGRPSVSHQSDLHFYALLETLTRKTPPFRVATYYLDSGVADTEDVTTDLLWSEAHRVAEGGLRMARLLAGNEPETLTPSPLCDYCPRLASCDVGQEARDRGWR